MDNKTNPNSQEITNIFTVFHQNIQCLKNKILEVELFIQNINPTPLFICLTEHWYTATEEYLMQLEAYTMISAWSRKNTIHGGSCIFVKNGVEAVEYEDIKNNSIEGHIECSSIMCRALKTIIICTYRPPTGNLDTFFEILTETLEICHNNFKKYKIILCGDFNINLEQVNNITQAFQTLLISHNLSQTIFSSTRITKNSRSLLDNIFINFENHYEGEVITTALSDHEGQIPRVETTDGIIENIKKEGKKRIFSNAKLQYYKHELQNTNWDIIYSCTDPNLAYEKFNNIITNTLDLIFPVKSIKMKNKPKYGSPKE